MKEIKKEDIEKVINALAKSIPKRNYNNFEYDFIDSTKIFKTFFSSYFSDIEGMACSVDKARYVANKIVKGLKEDKIIQLQQTYREYRDSGSSIGAIKELDKVAYWCPKTIKDTKEAMEIFSKWLLGVNFNKEENKDY